MRKLFILAGLFLLLAVPAWAVDVNVDVDIDQFGTFDIDTANMLDVDITSWGQFSSEYDLGYILYDVIDCNNDWVLTGRWDDGTFLPAWAIEEMDGVEAWTALSEDVDEDLDLGANGDFTDWNYFFRLKPGPIITDEPGTYDATITLTLGFDS